jgi:hypothetical protein
MRFLTKRSTRSSLPVTRREAATFQFLAAQMRCT